MRRTKEEAEKTKQKILSVATDIFSKKGFQTTSLLEIAEGANLTRGAIYWHFKNKCEIFRALQQGLHNHFIDLILQDLEKDNPEPLVQLKELCINLLLDLQHDPQKRQALTLFLIKSDFVGELACLKEAHDLHKKRSMDLLAEYLQRAKIKGFLEHNADTELMVTAINCYMIGILHEYLIIPDTYDIENKAPKLLNLFFSNLN